VTKMIYGLGLLILMIVLAPLGNFTADGWTMDKKGYENIYIDQFLKMMDHKDFFLINVHVPYYAEIAQTDLVVPFNEIEQHIADLPKDKDAKIVVYCMTGPMGDIAAEKLAGMGYTRVSNFQGGMMAWTQAGRNLQRRLK
jgi:rhodanese-related sulfurtransferase